MVYTKVVKKNETTKYNCTFYTLPNTGCEAYGLRVIILTKILKKSTIPRKKEQKTLGFYKNYAILDNKSTPDDGVTTVCGHE